MGQVVRCVLFLEVEEFILIHNSSKGIDSWQLGFWFLQCKQCVLGVTFLKDSIDVVHSSHPVDGTDVALNFCLGQQLLIRISLFL